MESRRIGSIGSVRISRIEEIHTSPPHVNEFARSQIIYSLPAMSDRRQRIAPNSPLAPFFPFFLTFVRGAHRLPRNPPWMGDVLGGSLPSLLMDEIKVAEGRRPMRVPFKLGRLGEKFVGCRDRIVARIRYVARSISGELIVT